MYDKYIQEQTDILTHRKLGRPTLVQTWKEIVRSAYRGRSRGQTGRKRERERGFETKGKWEGVPYMWVIGRERAWAGGRVWSEGCAGGEGRRHSEDSGREYIGGVCRKGRREQSC